MDKRLITFLSILSLFLSTLLIPANAAAKAGAKCNKAGITSVTAGKTFKCVKSGKKLVWSKGVSISINPKSVLSDPAQFSELDKCRIKHLNPHGTSMVAGFPVVDRRVNLVKGLKAQIIGVDFPDKQATGAVNNAVNQGYVNDTENFWRNQSTNQLKFEWNWKKDWIRMPLPVKNYDLGGKFSEGKFRDQPYWSIIKNVISLADSTVDFSGVNLILIMFPDGMTFDEVGTSLVHTQGAYTTSEGIVYNLMLAGGNLTINSHWYKHEFGHVLGLTDIRDIVTLGDQRSGEMYFDVMNNNLVEDLLVWHRFLLGFLENQQIHCVTSQLESTHMIAPVEANTNKLKGVVLPLSDTTGLIIEVRRPIGWDTEIGYSKLVYGVAVRFLAGTVVYSLDTSVPYQRTPVKVVKVLKLGESITSNGYKISVVESGSFGDVVKVERVD